MNVKFLILFVILGSVAASMMFNAPAIFVGYGLIYLVMLLAAWLFKPKIAFTTVLISTLIAIPVMLFTKAAFIEVAVLSAVVRPPVTYFASRVRWNNGLLASALCLSVLESLLALLIAILYFGDDGIHASLSIFGIMLAPFGYMMYLSIINEEKLKLVAGVLATLIFYLSLVTFPALLLTLTSALALLILTKRSVRTATPIILLILVLATVYGVTYDNNFRNNIKISVYPFIPQNWGEERWKQTNPECGVMENVFINTHTPSRLRIVATCMEVTGKVEKPPFIAGDGDYCFDIIPDSKDTLGIGNYILRKGGLHIEVVPADQLKLLSEIQGICPGDVVRVRGVWVVDTDHGMWTEIHPAFEIELLSSKSETRWPNCVLGKEFEE